MKKIFLILAIFSVITISCSNDDGDTQPVTQNPVLVGKGKLSANQLFTNQNILITNADDWQVILAHMEQVNPGITATFAETDIDFSTWQVLAAFQVKNSSTSVDISVSENDENIIASVQNLQMGLTQDVAHPFHIIKIGKSSKPVIFE